MAKITVADKVKPLVPGTVVFGGSVHWVVLNESPRNDPSDTHVRLASLNNGYTTDYPKKSLTVVAYAVTLDNE